MDTALNENQTELGVGVLDPRISIKRVCTCMRERERERTNLAKEEEI